MALLPVTEALSRILETAVTLGSETVDLLSAAGRTLAAPITAGVDNPPFDSSAMDGYALRSADLARVPTTLDMIGESGAGRPFGGTVGTGQTVRIFTGATVPDGADAVVIQEDVSATGAKITINELAPRSANIRPRGQDFVKGDALIEPGRRLTARDVLLAAASGHAELVVTRRPIVAILATGDELVEPGTPLGAGQIAASNGYALAAVVAAAGGEPRLLGRAKDSLASLTLSINAADAADVLLTIGGASVGDHDLVRPALEIAGARLDFYKIAMRPGKPLFFGTRSVAGSPQYCLGLPGNPVSALICARVFLVPLIGRLLGRDVPFETVDAILTQPLPANGPREHFMRATLDNEARVTPFNNQDSGLVTTLQRANALAVVPADAPAQPVGAKIKVLKLDI